MLPIVIYDTMTQQKRSFTPLQVGKVGIYVCGMTVYDYCHIGHARVMVGFDIVVRWLQHIGYDVNYVRNITDIDDKIIQRANDNQENISELTARFIDAMHEDADSLGCLRPHQEPRATDYIEQMQAIIQTLQQKNLAYQGANGDVYYAVDNFADYGKLSKRRLDQLQAGASERVNVETDKKNPFDFVLWKAAKPSDPHWASPWGVGRPGWHIECSAMSTCCLGETFDIHGGGHDLQFPHHENEIAQSEGANGKTYANHWMHVGFVNVDGEKMSKSLGNFFTIRDVKQSFHPETIRFFILSSHYRSPISFSDAALTEAHSGLTRLYQTLKNAQPYLLDNAKDIDSQAIGDNGSFAGYQADFYAAMNDDFNTAGAVSVLFGLARDINRVIERCHELMTADDNNSIDDNAKEHKHLSAQLSTLVNGLIYLAMPLNILQRSPSEFLQASIGDGGLSDSEIASKIEARQQAKLDKNYALADQIRQDLKIQGIELEDTKAGTTWRRL